MGEPHKAAKLALKVGVAGAVGAGAVISGLLLSRKGRHLIREAWQGRTRTRIEDRVLDAIWDDRALGARAIDVCELPEGQVELSGTVKNEAERSRAAQLAREVKGVTAVANRIEILAKA